MRVEEAVEWAELAAERWKSEATKGGPTPPRTKKGRVLEMLARRYKELPEDAPELSGFRAALLLYVEPLAKTTFFGSHLPRCYRARVEDFVQAALENLLLRLDRYFDPERGSFAGFATMTFRQFAHAESRKHGRQDDLVTVSSEAGKWEHAPRVSTPEGCLFDGVSSSQVFPSALMRFAEFIAGFDPEVARTARRAVGALTGRGSLPPTPSDPGARARFLHVQRRFSSLAREYLATYEEIESPAQLFA